MSYIILILILSGCDDKLSYSQINERQLEKNVQTFIQSVTDENGIHLFIDQNTLYVYVNGSNVTLGENSLIFTDFVVEADGDSLNILFNEEKTSDYTDKSLNRTLLYKVDLDKDYEHIKAYKNGEEVSFGVISGSL